MFLLITTKARLNRFVLGVPSSKQDRSGTLIEILGGIQINELLSYIVLRSVVNPRLRGAMSPTKRPCITLVQGFPSVSLTLAQIMFSLVILSCIPRQISLELHRVLILVSDPCLVRGTLRCLKALPTLPGILDYPVSTPAPGSIQAITRLTLSFVTEGF